MMTVLKTSISDPGFILDLQGPPGSFFLLTFFAVGTGGYHSGGMLSGIIDSTGRYRHFETSPFPLIDVGISGIRLGDSGEHPDWHDNPMNDLPSECIDRFENRHLPSGDVRLVSELDW